VLLDTPENQDIIKGIIVECHQSGNSWVALDGNKRVVGFVLARPDFHDSGALSESYIGVTVDLRRRGIFVSLMQKMRTNCVPS
jgi:hypothetical protein